MIDTDSSDDRRRALGVVYTPLREVELAIDAAVSHWLGQRPRAALAGARVVDPACGDGRFLAAYQRVASQPAMMVGVDADADALAAAQRALRDARLFHADAVVTDPARFAWGVHAPASYDFVLGNPPYVRCQSLRDPIGTDAAYRQHVRTTATRLAPRVKLGGRADLAAIFLLLGSSLLAANGVLAFVTTSAWLDAAYGQPLGRFLLDQGLVELIDRPRQRTFADASVGSLVVVLRQGADGPITIRRVGARTRRVDRVDMYAQPKWGGGLLRAGRIGRRLTRVASGCTEPLSASHRVGGYLITGADHVFYLDPAAARLIDQACVTPVVKSTRGESRIMLDGEPRRFLFSCVDPEAQAGATRRHLEQAAAAGVPLRPGLRTRRVWCRLRHAPAPILCVRTMRQRHIAYLNPHGWASGDMYRVWQQPSVSAEALAAFLNSAACGLQLEMLGRAYGGGGGPLKIERTDLVRLRVPFLDALASAAAALTAAIAPLRQRSIGTVAQERDASDRDGLERLCVELVGLRSTETDAVRAAHAASVAARLARADRVLRDQPGPAVTASGHAPSRRRRSRTAGSRRSYAQPTASTPPHGQGS